MTIHDWLVGIGLLLFAVGLWWIWPPLSLVFVGAVLATAGLVGWMKTIGHSE